MHFYRQGDEKGDNVALQQSITIWNQVLTQRARARVPLDWAKTQNNLGVTLWALGVRERGTARLEEAVATFRAALEELPRAQMQLDWATAQNNLGNVLGTLGIRETGTAQLEEAVVAYVRRWKRPPALGCHSTGRRSSITSALCLGARPTRKRNRTSQRGRCRPSLGARGIPTRASAASVGGDPDCSRLCAYDAWTTRERNRASQRGRYSLSSGA